MKTLLLTLLAATLLVTAAWAAAITHRANAPRECLTADDVSWYQNHSPHGISLTCNEDVRLRNLARLTGQ